MICRAGHPKRLTEMEKSKPEVAENREEQRRLPGCDSSEASVMYSSMES